MTTVATKQQQPIRSTIPARLDRLRWSPFHTRVVLGLGTIGYLIGGGIMIIGGIVEVFLGINAEGKSLVTVARPLTQVESGGSTS